MTGSGSTFATGHSLRLGRRDPIRSLLLAPPPETSGLGNTADYYRNYGIEKVA